MRHTLHLVQRTFLASVWAISLMLLVLLVVAYYGFVLFEYDYDDSYQGPVKQDRCCWPLQAARWARQV